MALANGEIAEAAIVSALVVMLVACLIAFVVYVACRAAGRPDFGAAGAAVVVILGAIFALLELV